MKTRLCVVCVSCPKFILVTGNKNEYELRNPNEKALKLIKLFLIYLLSFIN